MSTTASLGSVINTAQEALRVVQTVLAMTEIYYPAVCTPKNFSYYDYIIVGGGTAGSILANRLTASPANLSVLLIEAGGFPSFESELPAAFPLLPYSNYEYNFTGVDDNRTCQNLRNQRFDATQGKQLGGSGGLHHLYHTQGDAALYNRWAEISGDSKWNYTNILKYFNKSEQLLDDGILASPSAVYHGTTGPLNITKLNHPANQAYLDAYAELGWAVRDDVSGPSALGFTQPLVHVYDGYRTSGGRSYATQLTGRTNLCMSLSSTVTKVLISNKTATGVQMVDSSGNVYELYAKREVLVAAGAINTVKVLALSGIGPQEQLEKLNITVQADLPVGQKMQEHPCAVAGYQMDASDAAAQPTNFQAFPVPSTIGYKTLNSSSTSPDVQLISLFFPHDNTAQIQVTSRVFGYKNDICDKWYAGSNGRNTWLAALQLSSPKSTGTVRITSANYEDAPEITSGFFTVDDDLTLLAENFLDLHRLVNTTTFKNAEASLIEVSGCSGDTATLDFWKCYTLAMSASMRHYCSTAPMGSVLNSDLTVKGISNLRVIDSSAMPDIPIGEPMSSVVVLAERGAECVLETLANSCL